MGRVFTDAMFSPRRGNLVAYSDPVLDGGKLRRAIVVGRGRAHGRRVVFLDDGYWTYLENLRSILTGRHGPE